MEVFTASLQICSDHVGQMDFGNDANFQRLHDMLAPLGLAARRANTLCRVAYEVGIKGWPTATRLEADVPGCAGYIADCYELFYRAYLLTKAQQRAGMPVAWEAGDVITNRSFGNAAPDLVRWLTAPRVLWPHPGA